MAISLQFRTCRDCVIFCISSVFLLSSLTLYLNCRKLISSFENTHLASSCWLSGYDTGFEIVLSEVRRQGHPQKKEGSIFKNSFIQMTEKFAPTMVKKDGSFFHSQIFSLFSQRKKRTSKITIGWCLFIFHFL